MVTPCSFRWIIDLHLLSCADSGSGRPHASIFERGFPFEHLQLCQDFVLTDRKQAFCIGTEHVDAIAKTAVELGTQAVGGILVQLVAPAGTGIALDQGAE
jgi:hypothetical protein